jgi:hypothetical protein
MRIRKVAAVTVSVLVCLTQTASSAQAVAERCAAGEFCLWRLPDSAGQVSRSPAAEPGTCINATVTWPDGSVSRAGSQLNLLPRPIQVYESYDCTGDRLADDLYGEGGDITLANSFKVRRL